MVKAKPKPIAELKTVLSPYRRILNVGCGGCVSVCLAGGVKEVNVLNAELKIALGGDTRIDGHTIERQCNPRFVTDLAALVPEYDCLLSMACGAGVQFLAETYPQIPIFPAVNTVAIGIDREVGVYEERCRACGDCVIGYTGGICPITCCSKGLFNGPCGGVNLGQCEVGDDIPCAWTAVYERLKAIKPSLGWRNQVPRTIVQDDYVS